MITEALDIQETILLNAPIDEVWASLVDRNGIRPWLAARQFVLEIDDCGLIELAIMRGATAVEVVGETSFLNPPRQLMFTWIERDAQGREWDFPTVVSLAFDPRGDDTQVTLAHRGLKRLPLDTRETTLDQYRQFWQAKMQTDLPATIIQMQEAEA